MPKQNVIENYKLLKVIFFIFKNSRLVCALFKFLEEKQFPVNVIDQIFVTNINLTKLII